MTKSEFELKWKHLSSMQKKFVLAYLETLDPKESAIRAGYNAQFVRSPTYKILRKVSDVVDYLVAKNSIIQNIVKPEFVLKEYMKLFDNTRSEITKMAVLDKLSKILQMQYEGNKVEVNNVQQSPVTINFGKDDE